MYKTWQSHLLGKRSMIVSARRRRDTRSES